MTTGRKRGFGGLQQYDGILAVAPMGTLPLVHLLRAHLIELMRASVTRERRAAIASRLVTYITSPQFKGPIEEAAERAEDLQRILVQEAKDHFREWKRRAEHYVNIRWSSDQIRTSVATLLEGGRPRPLPRPERPPLALPPPQTQ